MLQEKGLRKVAAAAEIYNTLLLVRLLDKRPEIVSLQREIVAIGSQGVLIKPKGKFVVVATGYERDFFKTITTRG